jgi:hypothetical protein
MTLRTSRVLAVVLLAVFALVTPVFAQQYTGRIDVTVEDATGARLPGVTVTITGPMNRTVVSDARGEVHFLNLNVGDYELAATLSSFNDFKLARVQVVAGASVELPIKMVVAGTKEVVQVTAEAPVIDSKKSGTSTNVTLDELQNIPTARDPWVVMQSVPGIVMDRVNVGGSESGQQAGYMGKGAGSGDTTWNIDGMPITDMSSLSSPFYFDFDAFQEMGVVTGGADPKSATGGIQMNFMLKSGTNNFHGNGKFYWENPQNWGWMQTNNMDPALATALGSATGQGDRTNLFKDWGGDVGGPILKDRAWFWAAYGDQDIRIVKINGSNDRTVLQNASMKFSAQITNALRGSFTFFQANKKKWGRNAGATFSQPSTVDQQGFGGPNQMFKGEVNYVAGNNLFLVGRFAHVKGGFQLIPEGGESTPTWVNANGVWQASQSTYKTDRPQDSLVVDGNFFKGNHEFKFGFTWRKAAVHSTSTWGGDWWTDTYGAMSGVPVLAGTGAYPYMSVSVNAPYASDVSAKYYSFYVGDTITLKRMTINLGLRYDRQVASLLPSTEAAPANFANYLPAITAPGVDNALTYALFQPRVGLTYALDQNHKTQLRATYAAFTSQISAGIGSFLSVAQYRGFYIDALDANGDHVAQASEFIQSTYAGHIAAGDYWGYDPANPTGTAKAIHSVGDYGVPKTHELIVGVDHELLPNFGISASFTWRRIQDFNWRPIKHSSTGTTYIDGTDYTQLGSVTGSLPLGIAGSDAGNYTVPYYALTTGVAYDTAKGGLYTARPDYHQIYKGFEITATKRMSNHWMARLGFSANSWREHFDSAAGRGDPTPTLGSPNVDGGFVVSAAGGSGKSSIYMVQPLYQIIANGAYQLPYDIDIGANLIMRQGYPMPWNRSTSGGFTDKLGSTKALLLTYPDFGYARLPLVSTLDVRLGKRIKFNKATLNIDFDIFNLMNNSTVLGRQYKFTATNYSQIAEIMQPRIMRFGFRLAF